MLTNYLKSGLRFLRLNKLFVGINLICLSIALAASFIMLLYVINEFRCNYYNSKINRIYRVLNFNEEIKKTMATTPYFLANSLRAEFPQIENAIKLFNVQGLKLKIKDEYLNIPEAISTDSEIFDILTIPLIYRSSDNSLLENQNSIVISRELAEKIYPGLDPVGHEIVAQIRNEEYIFIVTGVYENIPFNSTIKAQCFINHKWTLGFLTRTYGWGNFNKDWSFNIWETYILLSKGSNPKIFKNLLTNFEKKYIGTKSHYHYSLQSLKNVYLGSDNISQPGIKANKNNIKIFSAFALLILIVATLNYIILSTTVSMGRRMEVGIRKAFGATQREVVNQLLSESLLLAFFVLPVAYILMRLALPFAEDIFQTKLNINSSNISLYCFAYLGLTIIIGIASGLYTSFYLSGLNIIDIFRNLTFLGKRKHLFRSSLIIVELIIFCSFISSSLIIRAQYKYEINKDLGYNNKNILLINFNDHVANSAYINTINSYPDVIMAAGTMEHLPLEPGLTVIRHNFQDNSKEVRLTGFLVGYNFIKTMGVPLIAGREFSREFGSDLDHSVILNETAVKSLGIIGDPIGQKIGEETIIGITKDFNLCSLHSEIPPIEISMANDYHIGQVAVHYKPGTLNRLLPKLEAEWKKVTPHKPFDFSRIEEVIRNQYSSESNLSDIISIFAVFTFLIAAFGLLGLTFFVSLSRTKEIGLRKIFGSSEKSIVYSFLVNNLILVVIASLISFPVTLLIMKNWLSNFPFKTSINPLIYIISFLISAIIVLSTAFLYAYKATHINPVEALKHE
jgi:putative ABC transport system permease protein